MHMTVCEGCAGTGSSSCNSSGRKGIAVQLASPALDGREVWGRVKAFTKPGATVSTPFSLLEVEAEADRLHMREQLLQSELASEERAKLRLRTAENAAAKGLEDGGNAPETGCVCSCPCCSLVKKPSCSCTALYSPGGMQTVLKGTGLDTPSGTNPEPHVQGSRGD